MQRILIRIKADLFVKCVHLHPGYAANLVATSRYYHCRIHICTEMWLLQNQIQNLLQLRSTKCEMDDVILWVSLYKMYMHCVIWLYLPFPCMTLYHSEYGHCSGCTEPWPLFHYNGHFPGVGIPVLEITWSYLYYGNSYSSMMGSLY